MPWLLDALLRQAAVIKDALPSFLFVWALTTVLLYLVFRHLYEDRLKSKDTLLATKDGLIDTLKAILALRAEEKPSKPQEPPINQSRAELEIRFGDSYVWKGLNTIRHRLCIFNVGPAVAEEVEVLITKMAPPPKAMLFRADFPYQLRGVDGNLGKHKINPKREEYFELCESWISTTNDLMIDGIDTKPRGSQSRFPMQPDEYWLVHVEVSCANADPKNAVLLFQHGDTSVVVSRVE